MKIILVDAWNTFVKENGIDKQIMSLLEEYPNQKIIVTNATVEEREKFGIVNMPYPIFSLSHNPNKDNSEYFNQLLTKYNLTPSNLVYFEHNIGAYSAAKSIGITSLHFQKNEEIGLLKNFLKNHL